MRPTRPFARTVAAGLAGCATALWAQVDGTEVELTQAMSAPLAAPAPVQPAADHATQTMLWHRRGAVGFGVGVEQRGAFAADQRHAYAADARLGYGAAGPGLQPRGDALLVGVSLATSERTRLSWQTTADNGAPLVHRPMKVSLSFQRTDALKELRRGSLLRMELSGQTTLALRARGGRLGVALTSRW